jgi:DNA polymerase-3 subunit delta'
VFIIDNAHNLTAAASNALLKTLEDPPKNSLIILVSPKPSLLLKTIVSRCQVVKFFPLPRARLEKILKQDFFLDGDLAHFLAYFCEGRLGQALALKDKEILREKNRVLDEFVLANKPDALRLALKDRGAIRDSLNMLSVWLRDIYLLKAGSPHSELVNLDRKADLLKLMPRFTFRDLDAGLGLISDSIFYLEHNINVKLLISNLKFSLAR